MNRVEFANKSRVARTFQIKVFYSISATSLFLIFASAYLGYAYFKSSDIEFIRRFGSIALVVIAFLIWAIFPRYLTNRKLKQLGVSCVNCSTPIDGRISEMVVMTNICPACGKNAFENA